MIDNIHELRQTSDTRYGDIIHNIVLMECEVRLDGEFPFATTNWYRCIGSSSIDLMKQF